MAISSEDKEHLDKCTLTVEQMLDRDVMNYGSSFHVVIEGKKYRIQPDKVVFIRDNKPFYYPEGPSKIVNLRG